MRLYVTADIHHAIRPEWRRLTIALARWCLERAEPGDLLALAGDLACADLRGLDECLGAFERFPGPKAFVPGNHDLWSAPGGAGVRALYERDLPRAAAAHGFALLDAGPLRAPLDGDAAGGVVALAGGYGGYDFSLASLDGLDADQRAEVEEGWRTGRFRHVFWNDYAYMADAEGRALDHAGFAVEQAARLDAHLGDLERDPGVQKVVCITHTGACLDEVRDHPAAAGRPREGIEWFRGLSGSRRLGEAIARSPKTRLHVCGHTHHERSHADPSGRRWVNLGCDYDRKRWLVWEPAREEVTYSPWIG